MFRFSDANSILFEEIPYVQKFVVDVFENTQVEFEFFVCGKKSNVIKTKRKLSITLNDSHMILKEENS